eukprot:PLAT941.1.p1 GENE.PLAT941.1~~PLAT941.1.p1  ORF type:complete len:216 (+),score=33.10 PLAT941.1:14-661(+)
MHLALLLLLAAAAVDASTICTVTVPNSACMPPSAVGFYLSASLCFQACEQTTGKSCCLFNSGGYNCDASSNPPSIGSLIPLAETRQCSTFGGEETPPPSPELLTAERCHEQCVAQGHVAGSPSWASCVRRCTQADEDGAGATHDGSTPISSSQATDKSSKKSHSLQQHGAVPPVDTALAIAAGVLLVAFVLLAWRLRHARRSTARAPVDTATGAL